MAGAAGRDDVARAARTNKLPDENCEDFLRKTHMIVIERKNVT